MQLTPHRQRTPITLTPPPEGIIRGRVIEPGGKPVFGAKAKVFGIDRLGVPVDNGLRTQNRLNLIWAAFPLSATTGADGRFTIRGVPREKLATVVVTEPRHERLVAYAATTENPQPENIHSVLRSTGFTLTAKLTDHVLNGRVVFEADGKPAAGRDLIRDGSVYKADDHGRFRIDGLVAGELDAAPSQDGPDAAPRVARAKYPRLPR